jgi:hypothetical protein
VGRLILLLALFACGGPENEALHPADAGAEPAPATAPRNFACSLNGGILTCKLLPR